MRVSLESFYSTTISLFYKAHIRFTTWKSLLFYASSYDIAHFYI